MSTKRSSYFLENNNKKRITFFKAIHKNKYSVESFLFDWQGDYFYPLFSSIKQTEKSSTVTCSERRIVVGWTLERVKSQGKIWWKNTVRNKGKAPRVSRDNSSKKGILLIDKLYSKKSRLTTDLSFSDFDLNSTGLWYYLFTIQPQ